MKCEQCIEGGKTSRVYSVGSTSTLMGGGGPYWDEDGVLHRHEPNVTTTGYQCSNGHSWYVRRKPRCPAEECQYNDNDLVNGGVVKW